MVSLQSIQDGEITIDSNEGLVYSSFIVEKTSRTGSCSISEIQEILLRTVELIMELDYLTTPYY